MSRIAPCIWRDRDALEAAELYVSAFDDSEIYVDCESGAQLDALWLAGGQVWGIVADYPLQYGEPDR